VLLDMLERHRVESKRTTDFLKYALGNRSKEPGRAIALQKVPEGRETHNS
jgi:hypothetical protein